MAEDYKASSELSRRALVRSGLSEGQAAIYEVLIQRGPLPATRLAFFAAVPRTLSYKHLEELVRLGLAYKKDESGKVARFVPAHPTKLRELAESRLKEAQGAKALAEEALPGLIHTYDAALGTQPHTDIYRVVAQYAGKACFEDLTEAERAALQAAAERLSTALKS